MRQDARPKPTIENCPFPRKAPERGVGPEGSGFGPFYSGHHHEAGENPPPRRGGKRAPSAPAPTRRMLSAVTARGSGGHVPGSRWAEVWVSAPSQPQAGSASANHPETRPLPTGPKGAGTSPPVRRRGETWTRPPCGGHDGARGTSRPSPNPRARGVPARFSPTPAVSASIPFLGAPPHPLNPNSEAPVLQQPAPLLCGTEGGSALCSHISQDAFL